ARSLRPMIVACGGPKLSASAANTISTASLRQPPSAVAKKFINERLASCRTRSGTSSGRCVARNRASPWVTMRLQLAPSTSHDDCATIPTSQADGEEDGAQSQGKGGGGDWREPRHRGWDRA